MTPDGILEVNCRYCKKKTNLKTILDLGDQPLSGVFPNKNESDPISGPLKLVMCESCELVQLSHDFPLSDMYGENYGYESSLNQTMSQHLKRKADNLRRKYLNTKTAKPNQYILDIGANDGTFIKEFSGPDFQCTVIDPTLIKLRERYMGFPNITLIEGFFPEAIPHEIENKFDLITSIAMFYDLPDPGKFVEAIAKNLDIEGVWHTEQSYLYAMLDTNAFDTICHEHLEYYTFSFIEKLSTDNGLKIIDVSSNKINGGSFSLTICHKNSTRPVNPKVDWFRKVEKNRHLGNELAAFTKRVIALKKDLFNLVKLLKESDMNIWCLGASTKGNVLLSYCGLNQTYISGILDVNPYKFGRFTPGTRIPIFDENDIQSKKIDYMLVLPWHFSEMLINRHSNYLQSGGSFIFPMPTLQILAD